MSAVTETGFPTGFSLKTLDISSIYQSKPNIESSDFSLKTLEISPIYQSKH